MLNHNMLLILVCAYHVTSYHTTLYNNDNNMITLVVPSEDPPRADGLVVPGALGPGLDQGPVGLALVIYVVCVFVLYLFGCVCFVALYAV